MEMENKKQGKIEMEIQIEIEMEWKIVTRHNGIDLWYLIHVCMQIVIYISKSLILYDPQQFWK